MRYGYDLIATIIAGPAIGLILGFCVSSTTRAEAINVINHGFEDISGNIVFNEFSFGPPAGWQIYDPQGIVVNNGAGPNFWVGTLMPTAPIFFNSGAPQGNRVAIAFNFSGTGNLGEYGVQQTLAANLQPNSQYRLQVEVGNIASGIAVSGEFFNLDGFPGYRIDILAGGTVIASDNNSLSGSLAEGEWGTSVIELLTDAAHPLLGQELAIRLVNLNVVDPLFPLADLEVDFDDVRMTVESISEPLPVLVNARLRHTGFGGVGSPVNPVKQLILRGGDPQLMELANMINSSQGINGLVLDFDGLSSIADINFEFTMSPQQDFDELSNPTTSWQAAPIPSAVTWLPEAGEGGSNRVQIEWPDQSIENRYLCVRAIHLSNTIAELYVGHLRGESTGASSVVFAVSFADINLIRAAIGQDADAGSSADIDKNGQVTFSDISAMRTNVGSVLTQITIPAIP